MPLSMTTLWYREQEEPDGTISLIATTMIPTAAEWNIKRWHVQTPVGTLNVSTVFLRLDHSFHEYGPPVVYETMVFGGDDNGMWQWRYRTRAEALWGHEQVVAALRNGEDPEIVDTITPPADLWAWYLAHPSVSKSKSVDLEPQPFASVEIYDEEEA